MKSLATIKAFCAFLSQVCIIYSSQFMIVDIINGRSLEDSVDDGLPVAISYLFLSMLIHNSIFLGPSSQSLVIGILGGFVGTSCVYALTVLFGAPLLSLQFRTMYLSIAVSSLTFLPLSTHSKSLDFQALLRGSSSDVDLSLRYSALGAIMGCYLGALPIPLDWDRPWQQWPLTCLYGAGGGYLLGSLAAFVHLIIKTNPTRSRHE